MQLNINRYSDVSLFIPHLDYKLDYFIMRLFFAFSKSKHKSHKIKEYMYFYWIINKDETLIFVKKHFH